MYPHAELTPDADMLPLITKNFEERNLLPNYGFTTEISKLPEDILARQELTGKTIAFTSAHGSINITFDASQMHFQRGTTTTTFMTTATKIADDIYFISWESDNFRGHIVCNLSTMQGFQHLLPSGERKEEICKATYA